MSCKSDTPVHDPGNPDKTPPIIHTILRFMLEDHPSQSLHIPLPVITIDDCHHRNVHKNIVYVCTEYHLVIELEAYKNNSTLRGILSQMGLVLFL